MGKSENRFQFLFDNMAQGVVFQKRNGKICFANPAAARILGLSIDRLQGKTSNDLDWRAIREDGSDFPGDEHPAMLALRTGKDAQAVMGVFHSGEEEYRWISVHAVPLIEQGDTEPEEVLTTFEDITDLKLAIEAVRKGAEQYRILTENMQDVVWIYDSEKEHFRYISPSVFRLRGYTPEEVMASTIEATLSEAHVDRIKSLMKERLLVFLENEADNDAFYSDEIQQPTKDGRTIWTEVITRYYRNKENGKIEIQGVSRDISKRKKAEAALQKSLEEKDVLMRELQHRVKNNLNVVNSLLSMESTRLTDERSQEVFLSAQTRIQAMSGIYEKLYSSKSLDKLDFKTYVKEFAESLHGLYSIDPSRITFSMDLEPLDLDLKRAVPLCLVLNELVSNALKYAYPGTERGVLSIFLKTKHDFAELLVRDTGPGLPPGVDPAKTDSMGFMLVRMLSEQLGGSSRVESEPGKGTRAIVRFPV